MQKIKVKSLIGSSFLISQQEQDRIGEGVYAKVVKAYNTSDLSQKLVAKIISCKDADRSATIKAEVLALKRVQPHPNLVNCVKTQLSSQNNFYLIMEYCNGGSLEKVIQKRANSMTEREIKQFLRQFCEGYKMLIKANLVHRDIKPDNVMINNNIYKIADFGFAKVLELVSIDNNMSTKGTPLYMAPELLTEGEGSNKVDVFSLGIILYRMAYKGTFPFYDPKRRYGGKQQYIKKMIATPLVFPNRPDRSKQLKDLITGMLQKNKNKRISWQQIFKHQFLKQEEQEEVYKSGMVSTLIFNKQLEITNNSILNVNLNHKSLEIPKMSSISEESSTGESVFEDKLVMQPIINNTTTELRSRLYNIKKVYTLIQHVSRRILKYTEHNAIVPYVEKMIMHCVASGLQYALYLIKQLQTLSGSWSQVESEVKNLQNIFNQDRQILTRLLLRVSNKQRYMTKQYQLSLYELLTQFPNYSQSLRTKLIHQVKFLIDLYDHLNGKKNESQDRILEDYIKQIESMESEEIDKMVLQELKSRGMLIL